jgi:hypothetical protein
MLTFGLLCEAGSPSSRHHLLQSHQPVSHQRGFRDLFWLSLSLRRMNVHSDFSRLKTDEKLVNWIKANISEKTSLPFSFQIPAELKPRTYRNMGTPDSVAGIIERMIVAEGLDVYDGAVGQIVLTMLGGRENLLLAYLPVEVYWQGRLGELSNIRAGYPVNQFIYDPQQPEAVSSDPEAKGRRGFVFRIINANGRYRMRDPLDGKTSVENFPNWPTLHWEDWKPVAGENAWVVLAALHLYQKKYYDPLADRYSPVINTAELLLAEEVARAALFLQAKNGGIRMAPLGTYRENEGADQPEGTWWYHQISSENNISWYAALRMLHALTGKEIYREAVDGIERYFQQVWDPQRKVFYQGLHFDGHGWQPNDGHFALDVQTWGILAFGPEKIDGWFGEGTAFQIWQKAKELSALRDAQGNLLGVGYTVEHDRISVEWTAGAILAVKRLAQYYREAHPNWAKELFKDARDMRYGIDRLRKELSETQAAYAYSSRRGWIPFGWFSHVPEVLSLASTGWVIFADNQFNPFELNGLRGIDIFTKVSELRRHKTIRHRDYVPPLGL